MKKLTLILFVSMLAVSLLFNFGFNEALAKTYVFKYANTQSDAHPRSKSMVFFKNMLEKASKGKIKVELFFSGVLVDPR